jgi:hypothetical protein
MGSRSTLLSLLLLAPLLVLFVAAAGVPVT